MIVVTLPVGLIQANCYVVGCEKTSTGASAGQHHPRPEDEGGPAQTAAVSRPGVVIDPGGHPHRILAEVRRRGLDLRYVLNTHAHFDHTEGNGAIVEATGAPLALHPADRPLLAAAGGAALFGVRAAQSPPPTVDLHDGDELEVGELRFRVLHTPGHTPGHVCFYEPNEGVLFDGDVLFYRGVGRADLPGGDWQVLMDSIHRVLLALPDDTIVYSGHGPPTTIGEERRHNPWLR